MAEEQENEARKFKTIKRIRILGQESEDLGLKRSNTRNRSFGKTYVSHDFTHEKETNKNTLSSVAL